MTELLAQLFTQETEFSADAARQSAGLAQLLARPERALVLVAREHDAVLGMVALILYCDLEAVTDEN